jgi:hypothetical protein
MRTRENVTLCVHCVSRYLRNPPSIIYCYEMSCPFNTNVVLSEAFLRFKFKRADCLLANILLPAGISSTNSGFRVIPVEIQRGGRKFGMFHTVH